MKATSASCASSTTRGFAACLFSYVNGRVFGLRPEPMVFITRNQTDRNPELQIFRRSFKNNFPPYFCLSAVCGIAMANGMRNLIMVRHDAQIAYAERYIESFRNSYSTLWESFGAQEIGNRGAYQMTIPPKLKPLPDVGHKSRAVAAP